MVCASCVESKDCRIIINTEQYIRVLSVVQSNNKFTSVCIIYSFWKEERERKKEKRGVGRKNQVNLACL
jgi:hypothetical protein